MAVDFHRDMSKYLANKRRRKLFSDIKLKIINKKTVASYKTADKFNELKRKVNEIKNRKKEVKKEISQDDIRRVIENKGKGHKIAVPVEEKHNGWKEVDIKDLKSEGGSLSVLEAEKRRLAENLARIKEREKAEKERIIRLGKEREHREKQESSEERAKRLELEEEIKILKEKQRIEEERLAELRKARKKEQMDSLKVKVKDVLFKKKPKVEKDIAEELRSEIRREAKIEEAERQRLESEKDQKEKGIYEERLQKKEGPKRSFISNFIQIKTAEDIAREEAELQRMEEEQALKAQSAISNIFGNEEMEEKGYAHEEQPAASQVFDDAEEEKQGMEEEQEPSEAAINSIFEKEDYTPSDEKNINIFSTLFPESQESKNAEDIIDLGKDYKIKVIKR
ncbi:hypothetical protein KY366_01160 [Candidatus Woesearchaeota archaeon]|nr:hypothetical protein [Candidatus Woesearchaeota archaeon]